MIPTEPTDSGAQPPEPARPGFEIEDLTVGAHAHGFGRSDGRTFAFRVRKSMLFVEVYGEYCEHSVPTPSDVVATAERSVTDIDLTDERSIAGVVRDAVLSTEADWSQPGPGDGVREGDGRSLPTVRAVLNRLGSIIDSVR